MNHTNEVTSLLDAFARLQLSHSDVAYISEVSHTISSILAIFAVTLGWGAPSETEFRTIVLLELWPLRVLSKNCALFRGVVSMVMTAIHFCCRLA